HEPVRRGHGAAGSRAAPPETGEGVMIGVAWIASEWLVRFEWSVVAWFIVVNGWYLLLLVSATLEMRRHARAVTGRGGRTPGSPLLPSVSVLAPLSDEQGTAIETVAALLALHYPNLEVV